LARNLNPSNRPVRIRLPGGVAGVMKGYPSSPYADWLLDGSLRCEPSDLGRTAERAAATAGLPRS